jgi:hypothetical protein
MITLCEKCGEPQGTFHSTIEWRAHIAHTVESILIIQQKDMELTSAADRDVLARTIAFALTVDSKNTTDHGCKVQLPPRGRTL